MKAYCCKERDGDGYAVIVYGKTRGQAKREGASELDEVKEFPKEVLEVLEVLKESEERKQILN